MAAPTTADSTVAPAAVDARAPRFIASVTAVVLTTVLIVSQFSAPAAAALLAAQAVVFGIGAIRGPLGHPYGLVFQSLIAPRLGPATQSDPVEQLRFAQLLGFLISGAGVAGFALGVPQLGIAATGFALFAALMRAVFGICVSRRPYMLVCKMRGQVPACCQNK